MRPDVVEIIATIDNVRKSAGNEKKEVIQNQTTPEKQNDYVTTSQSPNKNSTTNINA